MRTGRESCRHLEDQEVLPSVLTLFDLSSVRFRGVIQDDIVSVPKDASDGKSNVSSLSDRDHDDGKLGGIKPDGTPSFLHEIEVGG